MSIDSTMPSTRWGRLGAGLGAFALGALSLSWLLTTPAQAATDPPPPPLPTTTSPVNNHDLVSQTTSNPPSGSTVTPGQVIDYTVTTKNLKSATLNTVYIWVYRDLPTDGDDGALTLVPGSLSVTGDGTGGYESYALPTNIASSHGVLPAGGTITIKYQMKVSEDAAGGTVLRNSVGSGAAIAMADGDLPDKPSPQYLGGSNCPAQYVSLNVVKPTSETSPECSSTLTVAGGASPTETTTAPPETPLHVVKTSDPPNGSYAGPTQSVAYTVSVQNTGKTTLSKVFLNDDVSAQPISNFGQLGSVSLSIDGTPVGGQDATHSLPDGMSISAPLGTLGWTGSLAPGATAVLKYNLNLDGSAPSGTVLTSHVVVSANSGGDDAVWDHAIKSNCDTGDEPGCFSTLTVIGSATPYGLNDPTDPTGSGPTRTVPKHDSPRREPNRPEHPDCPGPWVDVPDDSSPDVPDVAPADAPVATSADTTAAQAGDAPADDANSSGTSADTGGSTRSNMLPVVAAIMLAVGAALLVGSRVLLRKTKS